MGALAGGSGGGADGPVAGPRAGPATGTDMDMGMEEPAVETEVMVVVVGRGAWACPWEASPTATPASRTLPLLPLPLLLPLPFKAPPTPMRELRWLDSAMPDDTEPTAVAAGVDADRAAPMPDTAPPVEKDVGRPSGAALCMEPSPPSKAEPGREPGREPLELSRSRK
jgi:hypothetical protein